MFNSIRMRAITSLGQVLITHESFQASGGGDDDKIPLQELTSNELNDKGDTLAGDKENVDMKVEEDYKPSSDAISSPSGATNNTAGKYTKV